MSAEDIAKVGRIEIRPFIGPLENTLVHYQEPQSITVRDSTANLDLLWKLVSRNGLLLCVQFVFTTLNNSLLFLVPLRELSRELRVINYNRRKIVGMTNLSFRGEGAGSCALKVYEHWSTHGRKKRFIVRLFRAPAN